VAVFGSQSVVSLYRNAISPLLLICLQITTKQICFHQNRSMPMSSFIAEITKIRLIVIRLCYRSTSLYSHRLSNCFSKRVANFAITPFGVMAELFNSQCGTKQGEQIMRSIRRLEQGLRFFGAKLNAVGFQTSQLRPSPSSKSSSNTEFDFQNQCQGVYDDENPVATRKALENISGTVFLKNGEAVKVSLKDLPDFLDKHADQVQLQKHLNMRRPRIKA
jgi:hypothetical protein